MKKSHYNVTLRDSERVQCVKVLATHTRSSELFFKKKPDAVAHICTSGTPTARWGIKKGDSTGSSQDS